MLRATVTHPGILAALASAGHGSTILIADGNFPFSSAPMPGAPIVYLNLSPGRVSVTEVLEAIVPVLPIEAAVLMDAEEGIPAAHAPVRAHLPEGVSVGVLCRREFYAATRAPTLALVIATGDSRHFANVLLTVGVTPPYT